MHNIAIQLAIEHAKDELKVRDITLAVFAHNQSAVKCYQSLGFYTYDIDENSRQFHGQKWSLLKNKARGYSKIIRLISTYHIVSSISLLRRFWSAVTRRAL
ncbi:GNAT family N-acetyltransferase [Spartinivicinus poritis]|uniref:GNAT family N-acetyltransferase n=1 Tax=Spartinivicinus poritis TaxID=2994640 RepID=UPI003CC909A0